MHQSNRIAIADLDTQFVIDIDLAILGSSTSKFNQFEANIRREYAWVPLPVYCEKRIEVLRRFLGRSPLYQTPHFQATYEMQAKQNLNQAIGNLQQAL